MSDEKYPSSFPIIKTKRLILRQLTLNDAKDVFEYASVPEMSRFLVWEYHKSIQDSIDFINFSANEFNSLSSIIWGIELAESKKIIGTIDLRNFYNKNKCAETGYGINIEYWNKGIVTESLSAILDYAFSELQLNRVESHCEPENTGSWRVMEKSGMKHEGTLREKIFMKNKFRTMKFYSILKSEWSKSEN